MLKDDGLLFLSSDRVELIAQIVLGGVFVYAGLGKVLHPDDFISSIRSYRILPGAFIRIAAYVLPWVELLFGSLLILNIYKRFSAAVLSILLLIFICAIISALVRGINIDCGCFLQRIDNKEFSILDGLMLIIRDILFLLLGIFIIFFRKRAVPKT
jgi:uncharacterized membrane protein YphA (DoxX/SURF4 family)